MSVLIKDYCKNAESELSQRLQMLLDRDVLIGSNELNFQEQGEMWVVRIHVHHTINCNDFGVIHETFDGLYWAVTTLLCDDGFEIMVSVSKDWL